MPATGVHVPACQRRAARPAGQHDLGAAGSRRRGGGAGRGDRAPAGAGAARHRAGRGPADGVLAATADHRNDTLCDDGAPRAQSSLAVAGAARPPVESCDGRNRGVASDRPASADLPSTLRRAIRPQHVARAAAGRRRVPQRRLSRNRSVLDQLAADRGSGHEGLASPGAGARLLLASLQTLLASVSVEASA